MKILILNWKDIKHPQVGGAEIIVYELAKRLVKSGHDITWYCMAYPKSSSLDEYDGIKIKRFGNLVSMYIGAPMFYWSLKQKPDLVIDCSNTVFWQTPVWAWRSRKVAYLNQFANEVFDYEYSRILSMIGKLVERIQYLTYYWSNFICYAQSTKQDLINIGISENKIKVFPLGIDHLRYKPGKKSPQPLFICVNRLVKMKRTHLAIEAMSKVIKKYPKTRLVIVGTGYERKNLENLRNSLNLQKEVSFADENTWFFKKDTKDKKLRLMQSAWALIFPSVKEGWGMTVTECGACATPSIVSDVTGLRDSVIKNITGLAASKDPSPDQLAYFMLEIIRTPRLRNKLSQNALTFSKSFTWENSYNAFIKLLL